MTIITDKESIEAYNRFCLKWDRKLLYGYNGKEDGFYKWLDTKQQELQDSNEQRSIPLKDSSKVLAGNGNSTLLGIEERSNLLQNKALPIPSSGIKRFTGKSHFEKSIKGWCTLYSTVKG